MTYRELFENKRMTDEISAQLSEAMEELAGDNHELKMKIAMIFHDGHLCRYTAEHKIKEMEPVAYIGADGHVINGIKGMMEYLSMMGITPESAHRHVKSAYEKARMKAREKGFSAPELDVNEWDCYWCIAMVLADYWYTVCGSLETASMIAYEYLSDPDR